MAANYGQGIYVEDDAEFMDDIIVRKQGRFMEAVLAPMIVLSTVLVANLNSDYLDGYHGSYYLNYANMSGKIETLANLPDINSSRLLGRYATGVGAVQEVTLGAGLMLSADGVLNTTGISGVYLPLAGGAMNGPEAKISWGTPTSHGSPGMFGTTDVTRGYAVWLGANVNAGPGTTFVQPRGTIASYAFTVNYHKAFSFNYAAPSGTNGSEISLTEVVKISNTGQILTLSNGNSSEWNVAYIDSPRRASLGGNINSVRVIDTRAVNPLPSTDLQFGAWFDFKQTATIGLPETQTFAAVMTVVPHGSNSGNNNTAYRLAQSGGNMYFQTYNANAWLSWQNIWSAPQNLTITGTPVNGQIVQYDGIKWTNSSSILPLISSQAQNTVFAAPRNAAGLPTFRLLFREDLYRAFGADATSGVADWNDVSNTMPGSTPTLLLGSAANGPGPGSYFHPFNFNYSSKTGTGNLTQFAIPYNSSPLSMWMRTRFNDVWSAWYKELNSINTIGTTDRVTVSHSATTSVINIATTYAGQASITTLGTITSGVWNGTAIDVARGGTGLTAVGTAGQLLRSTGSALEYFTPNYLTTIPTLQQVLTAGNVADKRITLSHATDNMGFGAASGTYAAAINASQEDGGASLIFTDNVGIWAIMYINGSYATIAGGGQLRVTVNPLMDDDLARKKYVDDTVAAAVSAVPIPTLQQVLDEGSSATGRNITITGGEVRVQDTANPVAGVILRTEDMGGYTAGKVIIRDSNYNAVGLYAGPGHFLVSTGAQIRVDTDPINANDLARKKYVDDTVAAVPIPTLQQVTTAGNTTNNDIIVSKTSSAFIGANTPSGYANLNASDSYSSVAVHSDYGDVSFSTSSFNTSLQMQTATYSAWIAYVADNNVLSMNAGHQLRAQQDPVHDNDLARKKYVDDKVAAIPGFTPAALSRTNDTNVTLTLTGTPNTALLQAVTVTAGWAGTLSVARGGSGAATLTGVLVGNGASAFTGVTGTANQLLRRNAANTAYEFWTPNYLTGNQVISLTGDVTGSGATSITTTIANGAVTLAKMAPLAANSLIGNNTGSAATPIALNATQVRALLNVADGATANVGTVTSIGMTVPTGFSVASSAITVSGTFAITYAAGYVGYTTAEQTKLAGIAAGANNYVHPNSGVTAGTYNNVTVNAQGHVTAGSNVAYLTSVSWGVITGKPTTLAGYGIEAEADARYVNVAGDTMTGNLIIKSSIGGKLSLINTADVSTAADLTFSNPTGNNWQIVSKNATSTYGVIDFWAADLTWEGETLATRNWVTSQNYLSGNQTITLTGAVTGSGTTSIATTLANSIVGNANLRNSAALSVIGRSANSTGAIADIAAGTEGHVLRRWGNSLGFGVIGNSSISDLAWSKLTDVPSTFAPAPHTLDSHSNVTITSPVTNQALMYNGSAWVNQTLPAAAVQTLTWTASTGNLAISSGNTVNLDGRYISFIGSSTQLMYNYTNVDFDNITGAKIIHAEPAINSPVGIGMLKNYETAERAIQEYTHTASADNFWWRTRLTVAGGWNTWMQVASRAWVTSTLGNGFVAKSGDTMTGGLAITGAGLTFNSDNQGVTFYGGAAVYKRSGSGLTLRRANDAVEVSIENAAATERYRIYNESWALMRGRTDTWQTGADLATIGLNSGVYYTTLSADRPTSDNGYAIHLSHNNNTAFWMQIFSPYIQGTKIYYRRNNNTTLEAWTAFASETWVGNNYTPIGRQIVAGNGLTGGGDFTTDRAIALGTPGSITLSSTNSVTSTSHTHAFAPGGNSGQYIRGDGVLATMPTVPTVNNGQLTLSTGIGLGGSATFTANQAGNSTFNITVTFGTTSGTVATGDDGRFAQGVAAYNWGNHASYGYVQSGRRIDTSGSIQGGGDFSTNRTFSLMGDVSTPGGSKYYGTNSGGSKGWWDLPSGGGGTVTGNGVSGRFAKWTGTNQIGNSNMYEESDGRIGIGAANPSYEILYVYGHVGVTNNVNMNTSRSRVMRTITAMVGSMDNSNDPSAALQIDSTTKGFLPPRMNTTQWNSIGSKAYGLIGFNDVENAIMWFSPGGTGMLKFTGTKYQVWVNPNWVDIH